MLTLNAPEAFDTAAAAYDRSFTDTALGRALRSRVRQRLALGFRPGSQVLELNCGTGEDAVWLASRGIRVTATDGSRAMLAVAERKLAALSPSASPVELRELRLEAPQGPFAPGSFDGVFSNFGGLNCVEDLGPLAGALRGWLRPQAVAIFVVMRRLSLWEAVHRLLRADRRGIAQRFRTEGTTARIGEEQVRVFYPSPLQVVRALAPGFRPERLAGLGVTLPPSPWNAAMERNPRLLRVLERGEQALADRWPFRHLGDHYILELRRVV